MKSIATRNNTTIDLQQYIKKELFDETGRQEIWLHNLPNTSFLFDIINKLREKYKDDTFVIKQNINITNKKINKEINFSNCIFQKNVNLSGCLFYKNSTFSYIKNKQGEIIANATIFQKEVNFFKANFKEHVNFSGCKFNLKANFSETFFGIKKEDNNSDESSSEVKFLIENAKFKKEVDFSKAIFYDAIYFSETEFCTDIEDYAKKSINFENAQFRKKVRFHHCKFHNTVRFENTLFNKLVDFYSAHFHKAQQFHFTDFLDRAIFSNTEFDEEVQFLHCKVTKDSYVRFESAIFNKGLDISRSNFNDKVNFWNIEIKEGDIFTSSKYADDFEVHKNEINPEKNIPSVYKQLRETYRIIKDNLYKQNNKIEGGNFYKKEMNIYLKELNNTIKDKKRKEKSDSTKKKVGSNPFIVLGFYLSGIFTSLYLFLYSVNFNDKHCYASFVCFFVPFIVFAYNKWNTKVPINKLHKVRKFWYCFFLSLYIGIYLLTLYYFPMYFSTIFIFEYSFLFIIVLLSYLFLDNDRILLYFNKYSNNFGTNWALGVIFTIVSSLVTYILILQQIFNELEFQLNLVGIGNFLRGLVNVLNVTEWRTVQFFEETPTNWQYIILFIGRILVAYGIYQTIQAFRKFGKS